jgi:hypothetical protein
MPETEFVEKPLPSVRLAAVRRVVASQPEVGPVVGPAFDAVADVIGGEPGALDIPIAEYETLTDGGYAIVAGFAYDGPERDGIEIVELPAVDAAVCATHLGSMSGIAESWHALSTAVADRGLTATATCREHYLQSASEDQSVWVTELQQPVIRP